MSGHYKRKWLREALLVSRSGYYDWLRRRHTPGPRAHENLVLRQRIRKEFERSHRTYSSPRLARVLAGAAGRYRIARLMQQERLWARQRSNRHDGQPPRRTDCAGPIAPTRAATA